jgi:hypothetical protein
MMNKAKYRSKWQSTPVTILGMRVPKPVTKETVAVGIIAAAPSTSSLSLGRGLG